MRARSRVLLLALLGTLSAACDPRGPSVRPPAGDPASTDLALVPGQVPVVPGADVFPPPAAVLGARVPGLMPLGALLRGELVAGDTPGTDGAVCDEYLVTLTAGEPVTFVARGGPSRTSPGNSLDMYLYLYYRGTEVAHDDDSAASGGALNSRIVWTPTTSGVYVLRVSTFGNGVKEGSYEVQSYRGALASQL